MKENAHPEYVVPKSIAATNNLLCNPDQVPALNKKNIVTIVFQGYTRAGSKVMQPMMLNDN